MKMTPKTVVFGIGAMGGALVRGWIVSKKIRSSQVTAVDMDSAKLKKAKNQFSIKTSMDGVRSVKGSRLILLAVKPQQMSELLSTVGPAFPKNVLVVSIAAGISTRQIEKALPQGCSVVRIMPNTPALLGAGMAAVAGGRRAKSSQVKTVLDLFSAVGRSVQVKESQMDLVTAVSGSGPAYIFHMIESMIGAAIKGGLASQTAWELVTQTVYGAARMARETGKSPTDLRTQVTSPGGTTQVALETMKALGFQRTVERAIQAATKRGAQLRKRTDGAKKDPGLEIKEDGGSCTISIKVLPRSSRNSVVGVENRALKVKIQAPPVGGAANEVLIEFLSELLDRPRKSIEVLKGQASRHKLLRLKGIGRTEALKAISEL